MFKKYLICLLLIVICLSCLTSAFAETIVYRDPGPVIIILNPDGSVNQRIWPQIQEYYTNKNNNTNNTNNNDDTSDAEPEVPKEIDNDLAKDIFKLTNEERKKAGLNELEYNYELQNAADLRAKESSELFGHTRPNGKDCYSAFNVNYNVAGENLIKADVPIATAETLMNSWMESSGHRANILLPEFTSIAIGIYTKDNVVYASQLFIG